MAAGRVLVIDDEANIRETMALALAAAGYAARTAADGVAGLELFGSGESWDLVLLDQRMPGMDGLEVLRRMRERNADAEVIMVTAFATVDLAVEAMKAGALDFLRKPFTPDVLRQTVAAGLERGRRGGVDAKIQQAAAAPWGRIPLVSFRSLDGYEYWPAPATTSGEDPAPGTVERTFIVKAPRGQREQCTVVFTRRARDLVRSDTGKDILPADKIWDAVSLSVLMTFMWERPGMPPARIEVSDLTLEQREIVRSLVKSQPFA